MAMAHKKAKDQRVGTVPYGWDLNADGVTLIENPAEQAAITIVRELRVRGMTYQAIADELTSRGYPTK
jgi:hypothetical protein